MARYQPHDKFYRRARQHGLPSRAAFKLEEIIARFRLVRAGARILDLGCAPGGWLAILARAAGERGRVVGIDLAECRPISPNVVTLIGDLRTAETRAALAEHLGGAADLLTCDLAPKLSGIRERDQALHRELIEMALALARATLKPSGAMVAKLFMGSEFEPLRQLFRATFLDLDLVHARATRPGSAELYMVARRLRAPRPQHDSSAG
jgi:23S rRNA (uridine2552-2'-O)-methyltransferase